MPNATLFSTWAFFRYTNNSRGIKELADMFKPLHALLLLTVLCAPVFAQESALRDDHPDSYTVQRGDTLWDISARFLNSPWLWPEIWQANPQLDNPHLIYPGDVISLVYSADGKPRLITERGGRPMKKLSPHIRREPIDASIKAVDLSDIQEFLGNRIVMPPDFTENGLPYVLAVEGDQINATAGRYIYVRDLQAARGDRYTIFRPTVVFKEIPPKGKKYWERPKEMKTENWEYEGGKSIADKMEEFWEYMLPSYYGEVNVLGKELIEVGTAVVQETGDPSTLEVETTTTEIKAGDMLLPLAIPDLDAQFMPRAPTVVPFNSRIVGVGSTHLYGTAARGVVAINKGHEDGLAPGDVMAVYHEGKKMRDTIKYPRDDVKTFFDLKGERRAASKVKLPDEYAGLVMVFQTFDQISYALVMESIKPVRPGNLLKMP